MNSNCYITQDGTEETALKSIEYFKQQEGAKQGKDLCYSQGSVMFVDASSCVDSSNLEWIKVVITETRLEHKI